MEPNLSRELTRDQRRQLLFLETCCVDRSGYVDARNMNSSDIAISKAWDEEGYIKFGALAAAFAESGRTYAVRLSDDAWSDAHELREARAKKSPPLTDDMLRGSRKPHPMDAPDHPAPIGNGD